MRSLVNAALRGPSVEALGLTNVLNIHYKEW